MPESRLAKCRAAYPRAFTEYGEREVIPDFSDRKSPDNPPRADDVWDELPILERGWNVIEADHY